MWGRDCCRAHLREWEDAVFRAQVAALEHGDAIPGHWDSVDADPAWRKRWWEPKPLGRRPLPAETRRDLAARYGGREGSVTTIVCARCGAVGELQWTSARPRFSGLHIDHVYPVLHGGGNEVANLQLLCPTCNLKKHAKVGG
jgi:5-methylcytosine-specific restriction endonuclease McrA